MSVVPIEAITQAEISAQQPVSFSAGMTRTETPFSRLMLQSVDRVNQKLIDADAVTTAFTTDDSIPLHQVTYALEQARMSFELMMQVRNRLTEAYQEIMRMQL